MFNKVVSVKHNLKVIRVWNLVAGRRNSYYQNQEVHDQPATMPQTNGELNIVFFTLLMEFNLSHLIFHFLTCFLIEKKVVSRILVYDFVISTVF